MNPYLTSNNNSLVINTLLSSSLLSGTILYVDYFFSVNHTIDTYTHMHACTLIPINKHTPYPSMSTSKNFEIRESPHVPCYG